MPGDGIALQKETWEGFIFIFMPAIKLKAQSMKVLAFLLA